MQTIQRLIATNWIALVANIVAHFALGMAWYGGLGGPWMTAIGKTMDQLNAEVPQTVYVIPVIVVILLTLFTAKLMDLAGERSVSGGVKWSLITTACVSLPILLLHYSFAGASPTLFLIDGGQEVVSALITGVVLGALGFRTRTATAPRPVPAAA